MSFSQENKDLETYPGKWNYTNDNLSNEWYAESFYKMNVAELQKYHTTTEKLLNFLHQQPFAQKPVGVTLNVSSRAAYENYDHELNPVKSSERVKADIFISFCNLIHKKGGVESMCDEVPYLELKTNDESDVYEPAMNFDLLDDKQAVKQFKEMFYLPAKLIYLGDGVYLYDWYYKNRIIVAGKNRPLWIPVTNKEYIKRMMTYYTASLKEGKITEMVIDALNKEIATVPIEMMNLPAYLNANSERPLTSISKSNDASAIALYKINPEYFDKNLPRTLVQLITITIEGNADSPDWGGYSAHKVWKFISSLKGNELLNLLDDSK